MHPLWKRYLLPLWSALMSLLVLAPVLGRGFVLHLDMVFVPRQTLLPWNLGIGGGLPRSVPQDAIVSLIAGPLSGALLQKLVLVAALFLAGLGAGRLAGTRPVVALAAASLYVWSPYLAARLLMGHWGLLWAFALMPWVVLAARHARTTGQWYRLAVLCGVGALVPSGALMLAGVAVPLALGFGSRMRATGKALLVASVVLFNAVWWLPAVRSEVADVSDPAGLMVFGARADGPGGVLLSVLSGGGVWNAQATLASRGTALAAMAVLLILALAALGWPVLRAQQRPEAIWLGIIGLAGVLWAWLSEVSAGQAWAQALVSDVPGGGLLRDAQKWTVFWVLLIALCAPLGLQRLTVHRERTTRLVLAGGLVLLPLAALPDLVWGSLGTLRTSQYPQSWERVRSELAADPRPGDVVSLPWTAYRRYGWNHRDVVLDPMPRFLTRTVVWNDSLPVTVGGRLVEVGGDEPRAAAISAALKTGAPLGEVLAELGIRWAVVQIDQPQPLAADTTGMRRVWSTDGLELWELRGEPASRAASDPLVVVTDLIALAWLVAMGVAGLVQRRIGVAGHATETS